jgi:hypothetical protein
MIQDRKVDGSLKSQSGAAVGELARRAAIDSREDARKLQRLTLVIPVRGEETQGQLLESLAMPRSVEGGDRSEPPAREGHWLGQWQVWQQDGKHSAVFLEEILSAFLGNITH